MNDEFGKEAPLTISRGKIHDYLGMTFDFSEDGMVQVDMINYVQSVIAEMPDVEIERSCFPRDRTSFFDALTKCCEVINSDSAFKGLSKNYLIIICDGDDTSSLKQQTDSLDLLRRTNASLIAIGLGLQGDSKSRNLMVAAAKASRGGLYLDIQEENFEVLFQVVSQYADFKKPYSELRSE